MMNLHVAVRFLVVIVATLPLLACEKGVGLSASGSGGAVCHAGEPQADGSPSTPLRPINTAHCDYDLEEFYRRALTLVSASSDSYAVERVEKAFGIPELATAYDDRRVSEYRGVIYGKGNWEVYLNVVEEFRYMGPDKFIPGPRPTRLATFQAAQAQVKLFIAINPNDVPGSEECLTNLAAQKGALDSGWARTDDAPGTDGLMPPPAFTRSDGRRYEVYSRYDPRLFTCVSDINLWKPARRD